MITAAAKQKVISGCLNTFTLLFISFTLTVSLTTFCGGYNGVGYLYIHIGVIYCW